MACLKNNLKPFVDWYEQPAHGIFSNAVAVQVVESLPDTLQSRYLGELKYVPVPLQGLPSAPGRPSLNLQSFFFGAIQEVSGGAGGYTIFIDNSDPVAAHLVVTSGHNVVKDVKLSIQNCVAAGQSLDMAASGDNGGNYEITLRQTVHIHIPVARRAAG
jgi:hypothetical protein